MVQGKGRKKGKRLDSGGRTKKGEKKLLSRLQKRK